MLFDIYVSKSLSEPEEKFTRENISPLAAVIEFGAFYKALGYKYIRLGIHEDHSLFPHCMPWEVLYGKWEDDEYFYPYL